MPLKTLGPIGPRPSGRGLKRCMAKRAYPLCFTPLLMPSILLVHCLTDSFSTMYAPTSPRLLDTPSSGQDLPSTTLSSPALCGPYAGLMCPLPMCPQPKILGCGAPLTQRPLDIVPLTDVSRPWTAASRQLALSASGT
jgi:hypothetical protein